MLKENDLAPEFTLLSDAKESVSLKDLRGKKVVIYFYPKDDTPGCTIEACNFRDNLPDLNRVNALVFGISCDDVDSHQKFKNKYQLTFPLLADTDKTVCTAYGVFKEKTNFGKKYMGIERSTFLIDEQGKIKKIWRNVKVDGHVDQVMEALAK